MFKCHLADNKQMNDFIASIMLLGAIASSEGVPAVLDDDQPAWADAGEEWRLGGAVNA